MESLGEFLKHGRAEAGLSLADLARRTRIRLENLESLEKDDLEALPTDPYVRGFVKQVCRELGLSAHDGLRRYESLKEHAAPDDEIVWAVERSRTEPGTLERALQDPARWVAAGRYGLIGAGAILVGVVVFLALRSGPERTQPPESSAPSPRSIAAASETPTASTGPAPEPVAESAPRELLSDDPSRIDDPPPLALTDVATRRQDAPAQAEALPKPSAPTEQPIASTPVPKTPAQGSAQTSESPRPAHVEPPAVSRPASSDRVVLTVQALQDVDVAVLLDGVGHPRTKSLRAGESKSWKADERFVLEASDGGALRVFLDGEDRGLAGPAGAPVSRLVIRSGSAR